MAVIIRPAHLEDAERIARVHVASWQTTYKGIVPDAYIASLTVERRLYSWQQILTRAGMLTYVAEDEDSRIVGFANGGPERAGDPFYRGELYAIYLLKEVQGRGLGRGLMRALLESLVNAEIYSLLLWVAAANHPSRRFYELMGGQYLRTKQEMFGESILEEVAYGWKDIRPVLYHGTIE